VRCINESLKGKRLWPEIGEKGAKERGNGERKSITVSLKEKRAAIMRGVGKTQQPWEKEKSFPSPVEDLSLREVKKKEGGKEDGKDAGKNNRAPQKKGKKKKRADEPLRARGDVLVKKGTV